MNRYVRSPRWMEMDISENSLDQGVMLIPQGNGAADLSRMLRLNETAYLIWNALKTPQSPADIEIEILNAFDAADTAEIQEDIRNTLESLTQEGAIERQ